eukprot:TRINITY_DN26284_c0_g1_i1.p1 TRINITY_DN26284_c0_g1~~TRINITY_DN26284_c0_g1_i1.p1  ORF type:complete len:919 (+),score=164.78 TRINITY_DN26284_c0_g1_i1:322-2757(+)
MAEKAKWLERYKPALKKHLPKETANISEEQLTTLASAVMDALLFAGGQSVPSVLQYALTIPYSKWGEENLPGDFCLCDLSTLPNYLWEVIRRFCPVSGFVFTDRSFGNDPEKMNFLCLQMAQRDPKVWGPDAGSFRLRSIAEYHMKSVGFAEPALAPGLASPNARACPARDLAFAMSLAFMREFVHTVDCLQEVRQTMQKQVWVAKKLEPSEFNGVHADLQPSEIQLDMYGTTTFILAKNAQALGPQEAERSGVALLEKLPDEERELLIQEVRRKNKFDEVNIHTRTMMGVMELIVRPGAEGPSTKVPVPTGEGPGSSLDTSVPFSGLRMVTSLPEGSTQKYRLEAALLGLAATVLEIPDNHLSLTEDKEHLRFFDSPLEAIVAVDSTFGHVLPAQYSSWADIGTDEGMVDLCTSGIGAWYLGAARSAEESGHEVPEGAAFESNLEYLSKYETRGTWTRYGSTAYLSSVSTESKSKMPSTLLGIWTCHHNCLVKPGDPQWEEAKACFRSSLCTSVTLKDHLAITHWIVANQLQSATRETLSADHAVRRLLSQFCYGTARINSLSTDLLLPVNSLGYRTFAFTEESWGSYMKDIFAEWTWQPFPEKFKGSKLPESFLESWALKQDGELVFDCFVKYTRNYLAIFYPSEDSMLADAEISAFWRHFDEHLPWKLPPLSLDALVSLLADLMWQVTAGHEFVGSIVEYLTLLSGCQPKIPSGSAVPDVNSLALCLIVMSLTGVRMPPLMDNWTHIFQVESWSNENRQAVLDVVRDFQAQLETCSAEIEERNVLRESRGEKKFMAFNPRILETSVSI